MTALTTSIDVKPRVHYTAPYFLQPTNPITVHLIGAGGTGSQVLIKLAQINHALCQLEHPGLHVRLWDSDTVSEANLGRQLFAQAEVGMNKAVALINRTNRFFGTNWKAVPVRFDQDAVRLERPDCANLFITCVDTVAARMDVAELLKKASKENYTRSKAFYWMDFGNSQHTGQVMLATVGKIKQPTSQKYQPVDQLPFITDEYGDLLKQSEDTDNTPSCSLAEALERQELFINPTLAHMGSSLLWNLFRNGMIENRGVFLNLLDLRSTPVKV